MNSYPGGFFESTAAIDDMRRKVLTVDCLEAELRMERVPLTAACRIGVGSLKVKETGEARWRIAVVSVGEC